MLTRLAKATKLFVAIAIPGLAVDGLGGNADAKLRRDGYLVVRDVFCASEIAWLRGEAKALITTHGRPLNGGLCSGPVPPELPLAGRLLSDRRLALPCDEKLPSEIHVHGDTHNDWHVDFDPPARIAKVDKASAWIYKIAIFLQDHPGRDGLSVLPGSHDDANASRTRLHLSTSAGDIIIFNHRTRHAGRLPRPGERIIADFADLLRRVRLVDFAQQQWLMLRLRHPLYPEYPKPQRLAIFLFFATHQEIGRRYAMLSLDPRETAAERRALTRKLRARGRLSNLNWFNPSRAPSERRAPPFA